MTQASCFSYKNISFFKILCAMVSHGTASISFNDVLLGKLRIIIRSIKLFILFMLKRHQTTSKKYKPCNLVSFIGLLTLYITKTHRTTLHLNCLLGLNPETCELIIHLPVLQVDKYWVNALICIHNSSILILFYDIVNLFQSLQRENFKGNLHLKEKPDKMWQKAHSYMLSDIIILTWQSV